MKKLLVCLLVLAMSISICSCGNNLEKKYTAPATTKFVDGTTGTYPAVTVKIDNTTPYDKLITKTVDIHKVVQKYFIDDFDGYYIDINRINHDLGIQCLRQTQATDSLESVLYSVHKVKQGGLLYMFYKNLESKRSGQLVNWFYVKDVLSHSDFSEIKSGSSINDVLKIDSATQIFMNIAGSDAEDYTGLVSQHYLKDGVLTYLYQLKDGEFRIADVYFLGDYGIFKRVANEKVVFCNGKILDIDRIG